MWLALCAALGTLAQQAPTPGPPEKFRARDYHEGVVVAAVPLADAAEAERVFGKNASPLRAGILPVEVLVFNQRAESIQVNSQRIQLLGDEEPCERLDPDQVGLRLYPLPKEKKPRPLAGPPSHAPRPLPDKEREKREEAVASLAAAEFRAERVGPGASARGYLYFDLGGEPPDFARLRLYVPEVSVASTGAALLFFEIELKPYAGKNAGPR